LLSASDLATVLSGKGLILFLFFIKIIKAIFSYAVGGIFVFIVGWALAGATVFISLVSYISDYYCCSCKFKNRFLFSDAG
jgi:hypothetical protein